MDGSRAQKMSGRITTGMALGSLWILGTIAACKPNPPDYPHGEDPSAMPSGVDASSGMNVAPGSSGQMAAVKSPAISPASLSSREILPDWTSPRAALVFTGDVHGYLEPCGCAEKQSGGFARRGGLIQILKENRKWPVTALDVGGSLNESRITYPQTRIKFDTMLRGLNQLGYQGQALGKEELLLGAQELYTEFTQVSSEENFHVPFLSANTTIFGSKDLGTPVNTRIVTAGNLKVGIAAIAGNSVRQELDHAGVTRDANELQVEDPRKILPTVIEQLKSEKPDLFVLLSAATMEESEALAREFPVFQIVVTSGSVEDPRSEPVYIGESLLVQVGKKGKNAAVVGVYPENKLKYAVLELDQERFPELPAMHDLMKDYQERLKAAWPELTAQKLSDPDGRQFVGAQSCKKCHTYAYGVWSQSKHAHALESLKKGRPGQEATWINRTWDPECLACHTTGWDAQKAIRYQSGFIDETQTPLLAGQQCENCHGAGSEHVSLETEWKRGTPVSPEMKQARSAMQLTLTRARAEVCLRCHDGDNSPHFDFDKYWPKVNHTGRKD